MRRNQCPADDTDPVRAPSVSQTLRALIRAAIASSRGCVRSRLGFVRTYGDIDPVAPRLVGQVLATIHDELPWHRVVRADGTLAKGRRQRALLVAEGVPMCGDRVDLRMARLSSTFERVQ